MRGFEASAVIDASPEAVWAVLTDGAGWTSWDSAVARFEGTIPDLGPSFERFANGLKHRVEGSVT